MANPIYAEVSSAGDTTYALDFFTNPFNVAYEIEVPPGVTVSYALNGTLDPINPTVGFGYGISVAPAPAWDQPIVASGATATKSGTITSPLVALQLAVSSISGGSIRLKIVQPFSIN